MALAATRRARDSSLKLHRSSILPPPRTSSSVSTSWRALASRSEEHTSELQSLMRISYAVFCLKKKNNQDKPNSQIYHNKYKNSQTNTTLRIPHTFVQSN